MEPHEWTVRVRAAGKDHATAFVRKHRFEVGAPVGFDVESERISALEYVLGAVGADLAVGLDRLLRLRRLPVDGVEAVVRGALDDPSAALGAVGAAGHPGLGKVGVKVYASTPAAESEVRAVWEETLRRSPLARTLRDAVSFDLELKVTM